MPILKVKVRFLDKQYHGKKSDRDAEWPPSPFRLFQAMLAGSGEHAGPVLKWLEKCSPPQITAPEIIGSSMLTLVGIKNNGDNKLEKFKSGSSYANSQDLYYNVIVTPKDHTLRTTMRQVMEGDRLDYVWSVDMTDCPGLDAIREVVRRVYRLGSSRDFVVCGCEFVDKLNHGPDVWIPGYRGTTLRTPMCGSYDSLVSSFKNGPHYGDCDNMTMVNTSRNIRFDEYQYGLRNDNQYIILKLVSLTGGRLGINPRRTCEVAAWVRHVLCDVAQKSNYAFPGGSDLYVAGHCHDKTTGKRLYDNEVARLAYVPLPSISGPYPDVLVRRVMVAGFGGINHAEHIEWVRRMLVGKILTDDFGKSVAVLAEDDYTCTNPFTGNSDSWFSVTPVVLPGYDHGGSQTMKLVRRVLEYANIGDVEVSLSRPICGMPIEYKVPKKMKGRSMRFLRLKFKKRVSGPMVLGIGRYCGLGLFARD